MGKVYDCFPFFNEMDLLEARLHELDPVVDRFVLVEATRNFQKKEKPLFFEQNKQRFAKFLPKIEHVIVTKYPTFFTKWRVPKTWDYDDHQKDQVAEGLKNCAPDDVLLISDVDEIPRVEKILEYKNKPGIKVFRQKMFWYFLNCFITDYNEPVKLAPEGYMPWHGSVMLNFRDFTTFKAARDCKNSNRPDLIMIENGGWHYSWLGGVERIIEKIEATAHKEFNTPENKTPEHIRKMLLEGKDLFGRNIKSKFVDPYEDTLKYIRAHREVFDAYVLK